MRDRLYLLAISVVICLRSFSCMFQFLLSCCPNLFVLLRGARGVAVAGPLLDEYRNVELVQASGEISLSSDVGVHTVSASMIQRFSKLFLIMFFAVGSSGVFFCLMLNEWMQNPNQRSWFLLGSAFYVLGALKYFWSELLLAMSQSFYLQLWVDRRSSSTLFKRYADAVVLVLINP